MPCFQRKWPGTLSKIIKIVWENNCENWYCWFRFESWECPKDDKERYVREMKAYKSKEKPKEEPDDDISDSAESDSD